jgi:hypothetical protein
MFARSSTTGDRCRGRQGDEVRFAHSGNRTRPTRGVPSTKTRLLYVANYGTERDKRSASTSDAASLNTLAARHTKANWPAGLNNATAVIVFGTGSSAAVGCVPPMQTGTSRPFVSSRSRAQLNSDRHLDPIRTRWLRVECRRRRSSAPAMATSRRFARSKGQAVSATGACRWTVSVGVVALGSHGDGLPWVRPATSSRFV